MRKSDSRIRHVFAKQVSGLRQMSDTSIRPTTHSTTRPSERLMFQTACGLTPSICGYFTAPTPMRRSDSRIRHLFAEQGFQGYGKCRIPASSPHSLNNRRPSERFQTACGLIPSICGYFTAPTPMHKSESRIRHVFAKQGFQGGGKCRIPASIPPLI